MSPHTNGIYGPSHAILEACSSIYVRNLVQKAIDQAFRLSDPNDQAGSIAKAERSAKSTNTGKQRTPGV